MKPSDVFFVDMQREQGFSYVGGAVHQSFHSFCVFINSQIHLNRVFFSHVTSIIHGHDIKGMDCFH